MQLEVRWRDGWQAKVRWVCELDENGSLAELSALRTHRNYITNPLMASRNHLLGEILLNSKPCMTEAPPYSTSPTASHSPFSDVSPSALQDISLLNEFRDNVFLLLSTVTHIACPLLIGPAS